MASHFTSRAAWRIPVQCQISAQFAPYRQHCIKDRTNADPSKVRSNLPPELEFPDDPAATRHERNFPRHADCGVMVTPENKKATRMDGLSA